MYLLNLKCPPYLTYTSLLMSTNSPTHLKYFTFTPNIPFSSLISLHPHSAIFKIYHLSFTSNEPSTSLSSPCYQGVNKVFQVNGQIVYDHRSIFADFLDSVLARHGKSSAAVRAPGGGEVCLAHGKPTRPQEERHAVSQYS